MKYQTICLNKKLDFSRNFLKFNIFRSNVLAYMNLYTYNTSLELVKCLRYGLNTRSCHTKHMSGVYFAWPKLTFVWYNYPYIFHITNVSNLSIYESDMSSQHSIVTFRP